MYIYDFLIFVGCLVLHIQCQTICKPNQYTVVSSNGSFIKCLNCATCHHGRGLYPPCGSHIPSPPNPDCRDCPAGEFSDELDSAACHSCHRCAEHEIITAPCTSQSNTICSGTCEAGYFYSKKDSTHSCKKCSYCCLDGRDEEIPECAKQGLKASKQHCHPRPDKDCNPGSPSVSPTYHLGGNEAPGNGGLSSSTITGIAVGVSGGVIVALAVGICLYCRRRKKKGAHSRMHHQSSAQNYARNGPVAEYAAQSNNSSRTQSNNAAGSREGYHAGTVERQDINGAISGVLYTANEQANQNATQSSLSSRNDLSEPDAAFVNLVAVKDDTSDRKPGESIGDPTPLPVIPEAAPPAVKEPAVKDEAATSGLKDNTSGSPLPKFSRQSSKDSQRSGDAESGRWRRSPSTSSFTETLKTLAKVSIKKQDSLVDNEEQDTDGSQGAIKIMQEPSSQEVKEGSKVELVFKCKAQGNSKLTYQWYKDESKLQGKDEGTLVFKSVTLPDFGQYKCVASCKDSSHSVESPLAELDVIPRDGTKYKSLKNIDFNTQDRIESLLTQKRYGLGGWREIASKYGMDRLDIKSLEKDPEAGRKTLDFLGSSMLDLTVYDFCKTLKEHNIRRLDIVEELLGHLSVSTSSKAYV